MSKKLATYSLVYQMRFQIFEKRFQNCRKTD